MESKPMELYRTEDQALTKTESQAVGRPVRRYEVPGVNDLELSDITLPRKRMCQHMSQTGEPGQFYDNLTEGSTPTLVVVPLNVKKQRVMFDKENVGEGKPLCASDNSIMPREGMAFPGPCATCPQAQWGPDSEPPACSLTFTYLFADLKDDGNPFVISFMRTSMASAKRINSLIKKYGLAFSLQLGTEEIKETGKKWFELRILDVDKLSPDEQRQFAAQAASLANVTIDLDDSDTIDGEELPF